MKTFPFIACLPDYKKTNVETIGYLLYYTPSYFLKYTPPTPTNTMLQCNLSQGMKEANSNSFQRGILTNTNRSMEIMNVNINTCEAKRQQQRQELDNATAAAATKRARAHNSQKPRISSNKVGFQRSKDTTTIDICTFFNSHHLSTTAFLDFL